MPNLADIENADCIYPKATMTDILRKEEMLPLVSTSIHLRKFYHDEHYAHLLTPNGERMLIAWSFVPDCCRKMGLERPPVDDDVATSSSYQTGGSVATPTVPQRNYYFGQGEENLWKIHTLPTRTDGAFAQGE